MSRGKFFFSFEPKSFTVIADVSNRIAADGCSPHCGLLCAMVNALFRHSELSVPFGDGLKVEDAHGCSISHAIMCSAGKGKR